jgi:creatinine amidohydrolase
MHHSPLRQEVVSRYILLYRQALFIKADIGKGTIMKTIRLLELSPKELSRRVSKKPLLLIPIGTVEWHADHLPLGVDSLLSVAICEEISLRTGCIVAPLISSGVCRDLQPKRGYVGTVDTIREKTLTNLVADLLQGYSKMGFQKAILFSGHFEMEHFSAVTEGIKKATSIQGEFMTALNFLQGRVRELEDVTLTWPYAGDHAAEWETSLMLEYYPDLVHMEHAPETIELDMAGLPEYIRKRYPRRASRGYGRKLRRAIIAAGVAMVRKVLG